MCGLRWSRVDLAGAVLTLRRSIAQHGGQVWEKDTKTHQQRRVALDPETVVVLTEHWDRCAARASSIGVELELEAFVFSLAPDSPTHLEPSVRPSTRRCTAPGTTTPPSSKCAAELRESEGVGDPDGGGLRPPERRGRPRGAGEGRISGCSPVLRMYGHHRGDRRAVEDIMSHPIVHAEIRSADPDGTRAFFGSLFGWTYPTEGAFPGYTLVDTGVPGALYTAISPLQGDDDLVTFFVGVQRMDDTIADALHLGGRVVQEPVTIPGVTFALIADPQGHVVGLAQQL